MDSFIKDLIGEDDISTVDELILKTVQNNREVIDDEILDMSKLLENVQSQLEDILE